MTSNDISRIELMLSEIRRDNAEFKAQIVKDNADFKESIITRLDAFENKINTRFDSMQAQIAVIQNDITGLKHDVTGLYHWDYWLLSIILVVFAMPQIVEGLKSLFGAIAEGISGIITAFRK